MQKTSQDSVGFFQKWLKMLEIFIGILTGFLTGLVPGLHINTILPYFSKSSGLFIISCAVAFIFSSAIPSLLIGFSNSENILNTMPGHRMYLNGKSLTGLLISFYSSLVSAVVSLFTFILLGYLVSLFYSSFSFFTPYLLVSILVFLFLTDSKSSIIIIILSGLLGIVALRNDMILPLLTGFFGMTTMIFSFKNNEKKPQRTDFIPKINAKTIIKISLLSSFLSSFFSLIPAVSSSITAMFSQIFGKMTDEEYISFISSTNMNYLIFSFYFAEIIGIYRSGASVFLSRIQNINLIQVVGIVLISSFLAGILCIFLAEKIIKIYGKINHKNLCIFSIGLMIFLNFIFTGFYGLIILFTSTFIGVLCVILKIKRINCMSCLIIPILM